jgi:hypothetical protein
MYDQVLKYCFTKILDCRGGLHDHTYIAHQLFWWAFLLCIGGLCSMFIPNGNSLFTMKKRELPQNIIQSGQCWLLFTPNNQRRDNILLDCIEPKQLRMLFLYVR